MSTKLGAAILTITATVLVAACGSGDNGSSSSGGGSGASAGGNKAPLKIALVAPSGGPLEIYGADAVKAWEYAAEEANAKGGVAGHRVELVKSSTSGQPAVTVRAVQKAVTQDDAHFIGAVITTPEHGALNPRLAGLNAIDINTMGRDDSLIGENCSPNAVHAVQSVSMDLTVLSEALKQFPVKRWAILAADYATGHSEAKSFAEQVKAHGGTVTSTQFAPLGSTEFGSYISKMKSGNPDGIYAAVYGADAVAFINQGTQFKLFEGKTVLGHNMVSEPLFKTLGDKIIGFYNNLGYDVSGSSASNQEFVKGWTEKNGSPPYYIPGNNYLGAQVLFAAVEKAGSVDPAKVKAAMADLQLDSIMGPITVRGADHQVIMPTYVGKVVEKDGGLAFERTLEVSGRDATPAPNPDCKM
jgi:ABC-type branched-subunit amino acid transport system substrate-binding protein